MSVDGTNENIAAPTPTSVATRMRLYRERRRMGTRSVRIQVCALEIETLVGKGYLEVERRGDPAAIQAAVETFFSDAIFNAS